MVKATYVSVWDGGIEVRTPCMFNKETQTAHDIGVVDILGLNTLEDEFVELTDGTIIHIDTEIT